jgi:hypothetical protein
MPPRSKQTARRTSKPATKSVPKKVRRTNTKALAVSDAVLREPLQPAKLINPLTLLEPLRRAVIDRQIEFFAVAMAWSPAHIIVKQQAAFWDAFTDGKVERGQPGKAPRKRAKRR